MINRVVAERYEILEAIGEGPLLAAFRARDRTLNRIVAVKTLRPSPAENPSVTERLRSGLATVLSLSHPGITRAYDVGTDEGSGALFFAEEYVRGIDLKERIRRVAPFSLTAATDVAIALAEALEFAHARGVVHGDIRPQNVLVGPEGQIKLTGFGVSGAQALLSDPGTLLRTVPYAAPDVSQGRGPTIPGDIYALGVTLFEMLTGDLPFAGEGPIQIALKHAQEPVPSPRTLNHGIPRALDGVVQKALGKRPEERYASASAMLADLRSVRDALRYGKSLSWSPQDSGPREDEATVAAALGAGAARAATSGEATVVMPVAGNRGGRAGGSEPRPAAPPGPEPVRESRWLSSLNLFLLALVLAGCAALAWMTLNFFKAPNDVIVPNLVGKTLIEAQAAAAEKKFTLEEVDRQFRDKEPADTIYQMKPVAGYHIREGKPVSIWVSKGPRLVEIPDVRDMSVERARRLIEKSGLRVGKMEKEFDPLVARGNVLRQSPEPFENRPRGIEVNLVLSKGEEPPPPPLPEEPLPETTDVSPDIGGTPGDLGVGDTGDGATIRVFNVSYKVPRDNQTHRIRIDVTDTDGTRTVYDEMREAGEQVKEDIEGVGKKIIIRLYDNDILREEKPL